MKIKTFIYSTMTAGLLAGCASETGEQTRLQAEAKITKTDAERVALARVPNGTVKQGELEKERGKLIWSFEIATPDSKDITEVNVDALTGEIAWVEKESAGKEKTEKKGEKD